MTLWARVSNVAKSWLPKDDRRRLWVIAGSLFVFGNAYKAYVWTVAEREILGQADANHVAATQHLAATRQSAAKFNLRPLSASEKQDASKR